MNQWFFTEEHRMLAKTVKDFAQSVLAPKIDHLDETEGYDKNYFQKLGDLGLLGITVSEDDGGSHMGCVAATIAMQELGAVDASTALTYLAHSILLVNNLATNASKEQKARYLSKLISGELDGGMGMTEPGSGSDALGMKSKAGLKGDHYLLNGSKTFITSGPNGDVFYCYAKMG